MQENRSLKAYNTFGVDVSAKYFVEVSSVEELIEIFKNAPTQKPFSSAAEVIFC